MIHKKGTKADGFWFTMPSPMDLPCQYGDYELLERIATGGMAEVYLARAFGVEGFEKRLVIKRILPSLATSDRFVSMFIQEAKICSLLTHPNVVHVFDLGRVDRSHYIAMEHIHGRDLTRTVKRLRAQGGQKRPKQAEIACPGSCWFLLAPRSLLGTSTFCRNSAVSHLLNCPLMTSISPTLRITVQVNT